MPDVSVPAPVQAVVDAINAADTEAFVNAFTADGYVDDWGRVFNGESSAFVTVAGDKVQGFRIPPHA